MANNKNKESVKFQGDMLIFCDFIRVFVSRGRLEKLCLKMSTLNMLGTSNLTFFIKTSNI